MDEITLKALAKINLGLDVVRRREDGYHEVRMIMQTIHLYDLLEIQKIREPEIQIVSNLSFLPVNENNLVYKAARLLQEEFALTDGISVKLDFLNEGRNAEKVAGMLKHFDFLKVCTSETQNTPTHIHLLSLGGWVGG